jgi:indole-3-glycerol phosphate synthase / phosphoribosylanthranilate isomerase
LSEPEHVNAAVEAEADMLGLIFHEPSHRYITPLQVRELVRASTSLSGPAPGKSTPDLVGVFVNKDADFINEVIDVAGLHFVQLHGSEPPEQLRQIKRPVIKALHIQRAEDLEEAIRYAPYAWRLLLDTPTPDWGGSGRTHDWQVSRQIVRSNTRILLAGGLTPENVTQAIDQVHPWGVDVSSGVETNKRKDTAKIQAFLQNVRQFAV